MNDKLICIKDEDDPRLIDLLSEWWKIIQISAAGILFMITIALIGIILVILIPITCTLLFSNQYDENDEEY